MMINGLRLELVHRVDADASCTATLLFEHNGPALTFDEDSRRHQDQLGDTH